MFIGHFALALAAKRTAPRVSLGILFAASQLIRATDRHRIVLPPVTQAPLVSIER
jgi:hypothetical protein